MEAQLALSHLGASGRPGFALDLELALPGRGFTALFGPSGSGKTSALRAIAGLLRARGRLVVHGEVWQDDAQRLFVPPHARALGYVFQDAALFPHLNVRANLDYGRKRVPAARQRVDFDQAVALLGLEPLLQRNPASLSGGERQRVAIGRAVAASPKLLLLDEPLASLDLKRRAELLPYLMSLQAQLDIPALYVSHAPEEVAQLASHLVLLGEQADGAGARTSRVLASGPTAELMTRLDLPLAHGDAAQAVLLGTVLSHDASTRLMRVGFGRHPAAGYETGRVGDRLGGSADSRGGEGGNVLLLPTAVANVGASRVVRVPARDVSLTLSRHTDTSILNILPATVLALADDTPGHCMVRLDVGGAVLLARITQQSAQALSVRPGLELFAQIKGAAIGA
ncbi:MAG: molybdenum ABC transporter ATP-binding protein [Methylibium sp. NZG]|nr:MAG: molybdenum ABC transporter ATP-binding protein [Methylibium sp. NZG]